LTGEQLVGYSLMTGVDILMVSALLFYFYLISWWCQFYQWHNVQNADGKFFSCLQMILAYSKYYDQPG